ncbi:MAG: class I SAM-dependent methyltransferase [Gammaproteobacteria bacterium]
MDNRIRGGLRPEGTAGIELLGHRDYVGGMWDQIGKLQFDFLIDNGLQPRDCLLDIGCGSLRGGIYFINFLDRGNYLGIDKEAELIRLGVEKELGSAAANTKQPEFIVSEKFDFSGFSRQPRISIAQSLFTHLHRSDIELCLANLADFVQTEHTLFATFFEGDSAANWNESHSHAGFRYSRSEMEDLGHRTGWRPTYVGDWNHPRDQKLIRYDTP